MAKDEELDLDATEHALRRCRHRLPNTVTLG